MIVTIDGPAGSGKSTAAQGLAARLGFRFLDTGAMYRVVGLLCLQRSADLSDQPTVTGQAENVEIRFDGGRVFADGVDVTPAIRTAEATRASSVVALYAGVRSAMTRLQRKLAAGSDIVTEGRDQGTVVFPEAECKFFLVADPEERARRRRRELQSQGTSITFDELLRQIHDRDRRDATRRVAPLKRAADALEIDTTKLGSNEVLSLMEQTVREKRARL